MNVIRFLNTIRRLKLSQIFWRIYYFFYKPRFIAANYLQINAPTFSWIQHVKHESSFIDFNKVIFLNVEVDISSQDIWNSKIYSKLWLYNLHYFDDLNASNAYLRSNWHIYMLNRWVNENPYGFGNGWEPYTISRRAVNWIKWAMSSNELAPNIHNSLLMQIRFLRKKIEWHILGNHVLANLKALIFAGLFFSGSESDEWYEHGMRLLEEQLSEQILEDGGHFELSPMYHLIVLEDLLDLVQLHKCYSKSIPDFLIIKLKKMLKWSRVMMHPDGDIPFFNDASFGVASNQNSLEYYSSKLNIDFSSFNILEGLCHLINSGYIRLSKGRACIFLDVAHVGPEYQPGHAHADTLSFEISINGKRLMVNGGTSLYGRGVDRERERKTISHNTVVIDGLNSSDVWGGFRVANRAKPLVLETMEASHELYAEAQHDGYLYLDGKPIHRRSLRVNDEKLIIHDQVVGTKFHLIEGIFQFAPGINLISVGANIFRVHQILDKKLICTIQFEDFLDTFLESATWSPYFGRIESIWRIRTMFSGTLPYSSVCTISWS